MEKFNKIFVLKMLDTKNKVYGLNEKKKKSLTILFDELLRIQKVSFQKPQSFYEYFLFLSNENEVTN